MSTNNVQNIETQGSEQCHVDDENPPKSSGDEKALRPSRIAFGSCNQQKLPQPLWSVIESRHPSAFVWGGDAIYADHLVKTNYKKFPPQPIIESATPERLRKYYAIQKAKSGYQSLLRTNLTVFGTIDDHDMGANNADSTYAYRKESVLEFLKFTDEPMDSPIMKRAQDGFGVYGVKVFDFEKPFGQQLVSDEDAAIDPDVVDANLPLSWKYSNRSVAIFVLDSRSNRTPWSKDWDLNYDGDFLGERQWTWFETAIRRSRASVNVIVQGMQVHTYRWPDGNGAEEWSKFPRARQRLYNAVLQEGVEAPILISGDVHMSQYMRKDCFMHDVYNGEFGGDSDDKRPLMEVTTSGMTHSWGTHFSSDVRYHTKWYALYYQLASWTFMTVAHIVFPWTDLLISSESNSADCTLEDKSTNEKLFENGGAEGAKTGKQYALDLNFGEMEFNWNERILSMRTIGRNMGNPPLLSAKWSFDQLSGRSPMPGSTYTTEDLRDAYTAYLKNAPLGNRNWICVNHRGTENQFQTNVGYAINSVVLVSTLLFPYLLLTSFIILLARKFIRKVQRT